ncbi:hypothetical protein SAMN02910293_01197 [Streptococcus henryi]|uniref:Class IIb bacteriocin, lactobin A/cerein 7B family n=1 Tax=Streptococcus henryi TaxID=439219 RepID=A0A1G6BTC0_9STRE|nr:hypothetical protein [Streptococcus henryi]SDB23787.1 hypothetical protein SAMN02910293_01197 [Streptococcus henryi]
MKELRKQELKSINDGELIITGVMIYTGVKIVSTSFALGYAIGQAIKYSR